MFGLVCTSGVLKLASAPLYIFVIDRYYGGRADAFGYSSAGMQIAPYLRHAALPPSGVGKVPGVGTVNFAAGMVYSLIGNNELAGFFLFSFIALLGLVMFERAVRIGLPSADHWLYARLIFLFPSVLFWTAAIGKDALVCFGLGLSCLGAAKVLRRVRGGLFNLICGLAVIALIRPHIALIVLVALGATYPLMNSRSREFSPLRPLTSFGVLVVLIGVGFGLARVTSSFLGIDGLSPSSISQVLTGISAHTGTAASGQVGFGSSVGGSVSLSPLRLPQDIYDIVVRPLPFQAHGITQIVASIENLFLVVLLITRRDSFLAVLRQPRRAPFAFFAGAYSLIWIILFASVGNLGLLDRERIQLLPFLFAIAVATRVDVVRGTAASDPGRTENVVADRIIERALP